MADYNASGTKRRLAYSGTDSDSASKRAKAGPAPAGSGTKRRLAYSGTDSDSAFPKAGRAKAGPALRGSIRKILGEKTSGLEITDGEISKGSLHCLPRAFMKYHPLKMTWIGTDDSTLSDHEKPFLTWVQKWIDAGDHPVQGKTSGGSIPNRVKRKSVAFAKDLRTMLSAAQLRQSYDEIRGASIDVFCRYLQMISNDMLGKMPGREPQEQWARSHLPAIFVLIWESIPEEFADPREFQSARKKICAQYDKCVAGLLHGATEEDTVIQSNPRVQQFAEWCSEHHFLTPDPSDNEEISDTNDVYLLGEIDKMSNDVFRDEVFLEALLQPHDQLMNRIAGLCNYDFHRVHQVQCGNAIGRFIAEVLGFWHQKLSEAHQRKFVQAALCRMPQYATIADHKEKLIRSCDEPANDCCNEGYYAMLQMRTVESGKFEVLDWDDDRAAPDRAHLESMRGGQIIIDSKKPVKAKTLDLYLFQAFQEKVCAMVCGYHQDEWHGTVLQTTWYLREELYPNLPYRELNDAHQKLENFYSRLYHVVRKQHKLHLPTYQPFSDHSEVICACVNILDALLMLRSLVNREMIALSHEMNSKTANPWDPHRSRQVDEAHMLCRHLENGWSIVVEICDPGHWIDEEFWKDLFHKNFKFDQAWARLWQQDSLPKLRWMIDELLTKYSRYIAAQEMMGATDLHAIATALKSKHPHPYAGIDFVPPEKRGLHPNGSPQECVVEKKQGHLKLRLPKTKEGGPNVDAWDARRWEGFSFNVNRVWLRQQEARAQHEQSTMLTFELWEHWLPKLQRECRIKIWIGKGGENINWLQQMTNTRVNKVSEDGNCWSVKGLDKDCERVVAYARAFQKNGHLPHSV